MINDVNRTITNIEPAAWIQNQHSDLLTLSNMPIIDDEYLNEKKNPASNINKTPPAEFLTPAEIKLLCSYFYNKKDNPLKPKNIRNYLYIILSVNTARRVGDILELKVSDVLEYDEFSGQVKFKSHLIISKEQKTKKSAIIFLNQPCKDALCEYFNYIVSYKMSDWLFPNYDKPGQHMTDDGMRKMIQRACELLGIEKHVATHSLRKTIPNYVIENSQDTKDEVMVSQLLNHSNIKTTYHYIGRTQKEMDEFLEKNGISM